MNELINWAMIEKKKLVILGVLLDGKFIRVRAEASTRSNQKRVIQ
jgi:hypothetical protein